MDSGGAMNLLWPMNISVSPWVWLIGLSIAAVIMLLVWQRRQYGIWNKVIKQYDPTSPFLVPRKKYVIQVILTLCLMVVLGGILALRPSVTTKVPTKKMQGLNLFFLIDVSNSMNIEDYHLSRIETIKQYIEVTLRQSGEGHSFGLAVFTNSFYFLSPLTTDMETFLYILRQVNPGMLQSHGTQLTEALTDMLDVVKSVQEKSELGESYRKPYFVVFSDGEDFSRSTLDLSGYEDFKGQFLFVGIGKDKAMPVPEFRRGKKSFIYDRSGNLVMSRVNFVQMQKLAELTGGEFQRFESDPLKRLLDRKSSHSFVGQSSWIDIRRPAYGIFGVLIFILILLKFVSRYQISFWILMLSLILPQMGFAIGPLTYYRHKQAMKDLKSEKLEDAKEKLQKNLKDSDAAAIEHYNMGLIESLGGNDSEAQKHFKESGTLNSQKDKLSSEELKASVLAPMTQGMLAAKQQDWAQAIDRFKDSLDATFEVSESESWLQAFQKKARGHLADALEKQKQQQNQKNQDGQQSQDKDSQKDNQKGESKQDPKESAQKQEEKKQNASDNMKEKEEKLKAAVAEAEKKKAEELKKKLMERKVKQDHLTKGRKVTPLVIPRSGDRKDYQDEDTGPSY